MRKLKKLNKPRNPVAKAVRLLKPKRIASRKVYNRKRRPQ